MTSKIAIFTLSAFAMSLAACIPKPYMPPKANMPDMSKYNVFSTEGGSPGPVQISGVVVNQDGLDKRITIEQKGGKGASGKVATFQSEKTVFLKRELGADTNFKEPTAGSIINLGCDARAFESFAKKHNLKPVLPTNDERKLTTSMSAETVMLCGKIIFDMQFVTVDADTLILDHVDYTHSGIATVTRFSANHLKLSGENHVTARSTEIELTEILGAGFNLDVAKSLESTPDGSLRITTTGSNYKKSK